MNDANIRLYLTADHPCSYLENHTARSLLVDPKQPVNRRLASALAEKGYRRSGKYYYKPHCENCNACKAIRVDIGSFKLNRRFKRILIRNEDLQFKVLDTIDNEECFQLFSSYIEQRHDDGDMYPPDRDNYRQFLASDTEEQFYVGLYKDDILLCVMVIDHFNQALSAVYTFFDPAESKRSLGTYAVLWQIQRCQQLSYPYLYLGFLIEESVKMAYKKEFSPGQVFVDEKWHQLDAGPLCR